MDFGFTAALLEWAMEHERPFRVLASIAGIISVIFGVGIGWLLKLLHSRRSRREYRNMENPGIVVFQGFILRRENDGSISLKIITWGGKHTLQNLLHDSVLEGKVEREAQERNGFICLEQPGQMLFMDGLEDEITNNDPSANVDAMKGRMTSSDKLLMCPISWPGKREAHLIRVVLLDPDWIDDLCKPEVVANIKATRKRNQYKVEWLSEIARKWHDHESRREEEDQCIRLIEFESQH